MCCGVRSFAYVCMLVWLGVSVFVRLRVRAFCVCDVCVCLAGLVVGLSACLFVGVLLLAVIVVLVV